LTITGQKNETGELVKTESARVWDRMSIKQTRKLNLGHWNHNSQTLDARNPATNANIKL
jgi:hypothetical protein